MSVRALSWVFERSPVEHRSDLLVLLVLADHARDDGSGAYPSVNTISRKARLSRRGVFAALDRLKAAGAIERDGETGPKGTISYRVILPDPVQSLHGAAAAPVQSAARGGAVSSTGGCSPLHPNRLLTTPEPSKPPATRARPNEGNGEDTERLREILAPLLAEGTVERVGDVKRTVKVAHQHDLAGAELEAFTRTFVDDKPDVRDAAAVLAARIAAGDHHAARHHTAARQATEDDRIANEILPFIPEIVEAFGPDGRPALITNIRGVTENLARDGSTPTPKQVATAVARDWAHLLTTAESEAAA